MINAKHMIISILIVCTLSGCKDITQKKFEDSTSLPINEQNADESATTIEQLKKEDFVFDEENIINIETTLWGNVNIVTGIVDVNKSYPVAFLVNDKEEILFEFPASFKTGTEIDEIVVLDFNQDGFKDVVFYTSFEDPDIAPIRWSFYQDAEKGFYLNEAFQFTASENLDLDYIRAGEFECLYGITEDELDSINHVYANLKDESQWLYMDLNVDGNNEMIWCEERNGQLVVTAVFAITENGSELVLWDVNDSGEFYFVLNESIVHYYRYSGIYESYTFSVSVFDENCSRTLQSQYQVIKITDSQEIMINFGEDVKEGIYYKKYTYSDGDTKEEVLPEEEWIYDLESVVGEFEFESMLQ